ncbi:MAG: acyltransferase [Rhizobiaceae bacterium]
MRQGIPYRPEIDGLRCVAVVSVVLFHSGLGVANGGYVGVDIFFVISGYLITSIILTEVDNREFSYLAFYERRIRRLVPALLVMLATTWLFASALLESGAYQEFTLSLLSVIGGLANWFFYFQSGYFDAPSQDKMLLHLWSLGVEEQFYIFFPFFLFALVKFQSRRRLVVGVAVLAATSFIYSVVLVAGEEFDKAFYDTVARAWELLAGAFLAIGISPPAEPARSPRCTLPGCNGYRVRCFRIRQ